MQTAEEIRADIERLKAKNLAARRARGVPDEEPPDFVPIPLAMVLADKLRPFVDYATRYTDLLNKAQKPIEVDVGQFEQYREYADLMYKANGHIAPTIGVSITGILRKMAMVNDKAANEPDADVTGEVRGLFMGLRMIAIATDSRPADEYEMDYEEYKRLKDDEQAFNEAYEEAREHYESIKELI